MHKNKGSKIPNPNVRGKKPAMPNPKITAPDFTFKTHYKWLINIKDGRFTNYHKGAGSYAKDVTQLIHTTIPFIYEHNQEIFKKGRMSSTPMNHSHQLKGNELLLVKKITAKIISNNIEEDFSWWQVGSIGGCRIIGVYRTAENSFYPLFVDWHHLIYPNKKYNQPDFESFDYTPEN